MLLWQTPQSPPILCIHIQFEIHFFGYPSGPQNGLRQKSRVCHGFIPFEHVDLYQGAGSRTALVTKVRCRGPASHPLSLGKSLFRFTFKSDLGFVLCFSCLFSSLAYFFPSDLTLFFSSLGLLLGYDLTCLVEIASLPQNDIYRQKELLSSGLAPFSGRISPSQWAQNSL